MDEIFQIMSDNLSSLEGFYLYFDKQEKKWIHSDKISGNGTESNFEGQGVMNIENSNSTSQMSVHPFYMKYPFKAVVNLGARYQSNYVLCYSL